MAILHMSSFFDMTFQAAGPEAKIKPSGSLTRAVELVRLSGCDSVAIVEFDMYISTHIGHTTETQFAGICDH